MLVGEHLTSEVPCLVTSCGHCWSLCPCSAGPPPSPDSPHFLRLAQTSTLPPVSARGQCLLSRSRPDTRPSSLFRLQLVWGRLPKAGQLSLLSEQRRPWVYTEGCRQETSLWPPCKMLASEWGGVRGRQERGSKAGTGRKTDTLKITLENPLGRCHMRNRLSICFPCWVGRDHHWQSSLLS